MDEFSGQYDEVMKKYFDLHFITEMIRSLKYKEDYKNIPIKNIVFDILHQVSYYCNIPKIIPDEKEPEEDVRMFGMYQFYRPCSCDKEREFEDCEKDGTLIDEQYHTSWYGNHTVKIYKCNNCGGWYDDNFPVVMA